MYVAGTTNSGTSHYDRRLQSGPGSAGTNHVFFSKFDSSGSVNLYSTYLSGTTGIDSSSALAVDTLSRAMSSALPVPQITTTPGALQLTAAAINQFFFSKVDPTASGTNSLPYSTFFGGSLPSSGAVTGGAIAVDSTFNVYLAGGTSFTDMPLVNANQGTYLGGAHDVWAAKLKAPANNTQQYTVFYETYLGGSGDVIAYGVATDGTNTFITGSTTSTGFTIPTGFLLSGQQCGRYRSFVAKFCPPTIVSTTQGSVPLSYCTYLGGTAADAGLSIATDTTSGNARVTGFTNSTDFPVTTPTPGSNIQAGSGGGRDAFVARIVTNSITSTTNTSTANYLGGSERHGTSIAIDANLNDYVAGETNSPEPLAGCCFPATTGALQGSLSGPTDAFVAKLGPSTSGLSFTCTGVAGCPSPVPTNPAVNPTPVGVGNQVTFKYSIYNTGDPVAGVLFTDTLGANTTFSSATASPGTCPSSAVNGTVVCNLGTIPTSITTSSGTTKTTAPAATVSIVVASTVPSVNGVMPPSRLPSATVQL
jgi:uncharacterized repeat protein (TIGR01451 family)